MAKATSPQTKQDSTNTNETTESSTGAATGVDRNAGATAGNAAEDTRHRRDRDAQGRIIARSKACSSNSSRAATTGRRNASSDRSAKS